MTSGNSQDVRQSQFVEAETSASTGPVECLGMMFGSDEDRRTYFTERLREKLRDPEFRKIEGFPIGSDEDILALSDPPYYTACPNPFLEDFIRCYGTPYDPNMPYRCEPLAVDVSEGKADPIYTAHSYHTKVPHKAIMRYILHYTKPGDVVFDGFCGTGMTGIAAQACGTIEGAARRDIEADMPGVQWGARYPVLCDLSVLPTFIAYNLNTSINDWSVRSVFARLLDEAGQRFGEYFHTRHTDGRIGTMEYVVWSDVYTCPNCAGEVVFWDAAVDLEAGEQANLFSCTNCGVTLQKRALERCFDYRFDPMVGELRKFAKRVIVQIVYTIGGKRYKKSPDDDDLKLADALYDIAPVRWIPLTEVPRLDRFYKDGLHLVELTHYYRFYFPRTLHVLAFLWSAIDRLSENVQVKNRLRFILTSMLDRNLTIRNRFVINQHNPQGRINGPLANTLYVPGLSVEQNPLEALRYKSRDVLMANLRSSSPVAITTQDLSSVKLPENIVDYIFVDPPFGHNIMYSELNGLSESWLRVRSNNLPEAVVSEAQGKSTNNYMRCMERCFVNCFRVLKPGRWMTVEFHNSQNSIWMAIHQAIVGAGFVIADVRTLDKQKATINQEFYTSGAVKQDLVISAYKPNSELEERFKLEAGSEEGVWDFVRTHLGQIPVFVSAKDSRAEVIAERLGYLLFDRMVAFHVQRGVAVPLSAPEFYAGLRQRFPQRDEMFFLDNQAAEYDRKRLSVKEIQQLAIFVTNESSAIQWLRQQLTNKPQTQAELTPQFMRELGPWMKHEVLPEMMDLLEQNFLRYDGSGPIPAQIVSWMKKSADSRELLSSLPVREDGSVETDSPQLLTAARDRWYIPDPNKAIDLERLRLRALLREFSEYAEGKGRLKVFRTEAVRAGFAQAWKNKNYGVIVRVAERLPEAVLQEDPDLLMYYDNASLRVG